MYVPGILTLSLGLVVAFSLSDYGLVMKGQAIVAAVVGLWVLVCLVLRADGWAMQRHIPIYMTLMAPLFLLNVMLGRTFTSVVFVPLIAYAVFHMTRAEEREISLRRLALAILYVVVIPCVTLEVLIKLGFFNFAPYKHLIATVGDARLDVLRVKSPFGSPLSLASLLFALVFYFLYFTKRRLEIGVLLVLLLMTGSRTAFIASLVLILAQFATSVLAEGSQKTIKPFRAFAFMIAMGVILAGSVSYLERIGMGAIMERVLSIESYDVTEDASFLGRGDTTVSALFMLLEELPGSLFVALDERFISDSAFVSIAAQSGLLAGLVFFGLFFYRASRLIMGSVSKATFLGLFTLLVMMVGDAVVPLVSFFYFLMFYTHSDDTAEQRDELPYGKPLDRSPTA